MQQHDHPLTSKLAKADNLLVKFANIVLVAGGVLCLLVLLYIAYYYAWTGQREFESWMGGLLYYGSPALLASLLFASLRLRQSLRINLALVLFSAGVSIFAFETLLAVWSRLPSVSIDLARQKRVAAAKALGIEFDSRSKKQVVDDLRSEGIDAVPSVFANALLKEQNDGTIKSVIRINGSEVLPLAGTANKVVVVCNEGGQFLTYRSDQHGFNNPQQVWHMPIDVVAVGDSFTQGWCVAPSGNFVSLIRRRYPGTLNLGIEGNGPLVMLAAIKEYAESLRPKVILWFYCEGNDLRDLSKERRSPVLKGYLKTNEFSQHLASRQPEIDRAVAAYVETVTNKNQLLVKWEEMSAVVTNGDKWPGLLQDTIKLTQLRQRLGLVANITSEFDSNGPASLNMLQIDLLSEVLLETKKRVSKWGGNLYFVYLPTGGRYDPGTIDTRGRDAVLEAVSKTGVPVVDLHPAFRERKDPLALFALGLPRHHYNDEGHRLVADEVLRAISLNGQTGRAPSIRR